MGRSCKSGGCGRRSHHGGHYRGYRGSYWPSLYWGSSWPSYWNTYYGYPQRPINVTVESNDQSAQAIQQLQKSQAQIAEENQKALTALKAEMKSKVPHWVMPVGITFGILLLLAIVVIIVMMVKRRNTLIIN